MENETGFSSLTSPPLAALLAETGVNVPTDVQQKAIPLISGGVDVAASSPTGTGKTLAYLLPVLEKMSPDIKTPQAFVLTPTRELAAQVFKQAKALGANAVLLVGGGDLKRQAERLRGNSETKKPQLVVGTAGRVLEMIKLRKLSAHTVRTIVVDEADRMLDDTNFTQTRDVINTSHRDRQLLFFSATLSDCENKIRELGKDVRFVRASAKNRVPENISHVYFVCERREKFEILRKLTHALGIKKALVFMNNQNEIENLVKRLNYHHISAAALLATDTPKARKQALADFLQKDTTLLAATDVAARGLDVKNLKYVIHFDMPENPVFYLHRAGRCGRMGEPGVSVVIAEPREISAIKKCAAKLRVEFKRKELKGGEVLDRP